MSVIRYRSIKLKNSAGLDSSLAPRPDATRRHAILVLPVVGDVRPRLRTFICACEAGELGDVKSASSLQWKIIERYVHLLHRRELFDRENNFCIRRCVKGTEKFARPDCSLYFGVSDLA